MHKPKSWGTAFAAHSHTLLILALFCTHASRLPAGEAIPLILHHTTRHPLTDIDRLSCCDNSPQRPVKRSSRERERSINLSNSKYIDSPKSEGDYFLQSEKWGRGAIPIFSGFDAYTHTSDSPLGQFVTR